MVDESDAEQEYPAHTGNRPELPPWPEQLDNYRRSAELPEIPPTARTMKALRDRHRVIE